MIGTKPYAKLKYREVKGRQMAYIDEGEGDAIVFQDGQPASKSMIAWIVRYGIPAFLAITLSDLSSP